MDPKEAATRLYHDLGKAIVFTRRWVADDATAEERWNAVLDDVLRTRRGPTGVFSSVEIWKSFCLSDGAKECLDCADGNLLREKMAELATVLPKCTESDSVEHLVELEHLTDGIHQLCKRLKNHFHSDA